MPASSQEPTPQTPPRNSSLKEHNHHEDATPTTSSPSTSPSMSIHSLGMSPLSPRRRQISASLVASVSSKSSGRDGSQQRDSTGGSKDILIQRLNDLAAKLFEEDDVQENSIDTLHAKVDEMEKALRTSSRSRRHKHKHTRSYLEGRVSSDGVASMASSTSWISPPFLPMSSSNAHTPDQMAEPAENHEDKKKTTMSNDERRNRASPEQTANFLVETQKLHQSLQSVIANLKARQEEQEHIHDLLITRAERAAQRIIHLESRIKELSESERDESEMDILNLQIQLKAIEVQCLSYVPEDADPDLGRSIETWKAEMSALKRKRGRKKEAELAALSTPTSRVPRAPVTRSRTTPG